MRPSIRKSKNIIGHHLLESDNKAPQSTYFEHDIKNKIQYHHIFTSFYEKNGNQIVCV